MNIIEWLRDLWARVTRQPAHVIINRKHATIDRVSTELGNQVSQVASREVKGIAAAAASTARRAAALASTGALTGAADATLRGTVSVLNSAASTVAQHA